MFNTQGLNPSINSKSAWKIPYIIENHISDKHFTPIIALTETWLKPYISDAQIRIPQYQVIRADRKKRIRGGALLYIHDDLPVSNAETYAEKYCQAVLCTIKPSNTIIINAYRPPDTPEKSTTDLLKFITDYILAMTTWKLSSLETSTFLESTGKT